MKMVDTRLVGFNHVMSNKVKLLLKTTISLDKGTDVTLPAIKHFLLNANLVVTLIDTMMVPDKS